jgi:hypothetical protein
MGGRQKEAQAMMIAVVNNLPELVSGVILAAVFFRGGIAYARWRAR